MYAPSKFDPAPSCHRLCPLFRLQFAIQHCPVLGFRWDFQILCIAHLGADYLVMLFTCEYMSSAALITFEFDSYSMLELAFESPLVVHLLVKLRTYPIRLVKELKAHASAAWTALGSGRQTRLVQLPGWHQNGRAVAQAEQIPCSSG